MRILDASDDDFAEIQSVPQPALENALARSFTRRRTRDAVLLVNPSQEKLISLQACILDGLGAKLADSASWDDVFAGSAVELLEKSKIAVTTLFICAADGMASGAWKLSRFTVGSRGYLLFELYDDGPYAAGVLLVGWEPASATEGYRRALLWAYRNFGRDLKFPFTSSEIEIEFIDNEKLFRSTAKRALQHARS